MPIQVYEGQDQDIIITPSQPGVIRVYDNNVLTATYTIPRGDIHSVTYSLVDIQEAHVLNITFEAAQQYQITGTVVSGLSISPSFPQSVYTGEDISFTITPTSGGTIVVTDNGVETARYPISRTDIHSVVYEIVSVAEAHVLSITFEALQQYQVSGTVGSGLSVSPSLPQTVYTGDDFNLTITPARAGIIRVTDNGAEKGVYEIPTGQVAPVVYHIYAVGEAHVLNIQLDDLPTFTISSVYTETGLTISPALPQSAALGSDLTLTITPNDAGQITILDNDHEVAVHYILPENIHSVTHTISDIAADHEMEFKFSPLPSFTATASLTGTGSLSPSSKTDYGGRTVTFTITGVPSSNIIIAIQDGKNVSDQLTKSGTTYTYTLTLLKNTSIQFTSRVPTNVTVTATVDQDATVSPASQTLLEGNEYTLQITPDDYQTTATPPLSVSDNGEEVVDQLVAKKDTTAPTLTANNSSYTSLNSSNRGL